MNNKFGIAVIGLVIGAVIGYAVGSSRVGNLPATSDINSRTTADESAMKKEAKPIEVKFANHIQLKLPEQDVFIEPAGASGHVMRIEGDMAGKSEILAATAYAAARATAHDPFKLGENPLGPFPQGKSLGFTLDEWLAGTGSGTYIVTGETAKLDLTFANLVPNGVYTVWCSRLTFPPNVKIVDEPCGSADGSENSLTADADGNATFQLTLQPLEESTKETASVIALAYHSDGKTHGSNPGDFGFTTHVQLAFLLPAPDAALMKQ